MLLLIVIIAITYRYTSGDSIRNTSYYQQSMLNQLNKQIVMKLNAIEQASLAASRNVSVRSLFDAEEDTYLVYQHAKTAAEYLRSIVYSTDVLVSIDLYAKKPLPAEYEGTPVYFKDFERIHDAHWQEILDKNDFAWLPEDQDRAEEAAVPVIRFIRKVHAFNGQFECVLVFNVKSSAIRQLMQGDEDQAGVRLAERVLLDSGGRAVIGTDRLAASSLGLEQLYGEIYAGKNHYAHVRFDQASARKVNDALVVWSQLNDPNWTLVEITPWKQITEGSVRIAWLLAWIGLSAIIVALGVTLVLSRQFTSPIRILWQAMKRFDDTQVHSRESALPKDYRNEFGHMFKVYENMLERIQALYDSLKSRYIQQKEAEIQALQAMINPHFLYNTLDQANWMAIEAGQHNISKVLKLMGQMFRIGLSKGDYLIPVSEELDYVRCYIELQQIRFGGQIEFSIEVPQSMEHFYILKLTLQPFVENAVIHGLQEREHLNVRILAEETPEGLLFTVADDGMGMEEGWQSKSERKTGGYGIRNVQERLDAYFRAPYGIRFESEAGKGTTAAILQPRISNLTEWRDQHVENGNDRR